MSLKIKYVKDAGVIKDERIVLQAVRDCEIGIYLLFDTTYISEDSISNKLQHCFWFPDRSVQAGATIVVYSRSGNNSEKENQNGSQSYFYYWGLDRTLWNKDGDCAVLVEAKDWSFKRVK